MHRAEFDKNSQQLFACLSNSMTTMNVNAGFIMMSYLVSEGLEAPSHIPALASIRDNRGRDPFSFCANAFVPTNIFTI